MFINLGGINAEEDCIQQGRDIWQAYRTVVDFLFGGICLLFFINLFPSDCNQLVSTAQCYSQSSYEFLRVTQ